MECIRRTPDDLKDYFRKVSRRRVAKDRTIILDRRLYEAPVELIGKQVELLYHEDNVENVEVRWNQKSYGILTMVDLNVNCKVKRDKNNQVEISTEESNHKSGQIWED